MQVGIGEAGIDLNQSIIGSSPSQAEVYLRKDEVVHSTSDQGRIEFDSSAFRTEEKLDFDSYDYPNPDEHIPTNKEESEAFRAFEGEEDADDESMPEGIFPDEVIATESARILYHGNGNEYDSACVKEVGDFLQEAQLERDVEELQQSLKTLKAKTYRKVEALLLTPFENYSEQTLDDIVNTVRDFSVISDFVAKNAIAVATRHRIQEGHILNKAKEVFKQVKGLGWDKEAPELFPTYSKSTRCTLMNISQIIGVENHCAAGSERLRHAYSIIKKIKVEGPDQIAAMFEHFGEVYDQHFENTVYLDTFDRVLGWSKDPEGINNNEDLTVPADESLRGEGVNQLEEDKVENDESASANSAGLEEIATEDSDENRNASMADIESGENISGDDIVPAVTKPAETVEGGADVAVTDSAFKENEKEAKKKRFLDQESLNIILAGFIKTVDELLNLEPPTYRLDIIKFDEARACLDRLEEYVKNGSAQ